MSRRKCLQIRCTNVCKRMFVCVCVCMYADILELVGSKEREANKSRKVSADQVCVCMCVCMYANMHMRELVESKEREANEPRKVSADQVHECTNAYIIIRTCTHTHTNTYIQTYIV